MASAIPSATLDSAVPALTRLAVVARTSPELIERVCRLLRHRGATLEHLVVTARGDGQTTLDVTARCCGNTELLMRQLERLADVRSTRHVDPRVSQ